MRYKILICLLFVLLSGCKFDNTKENLKWFDSQEESIENGLVEEGILKSDILGLVESNGEVFVFFKTNVSKGTAVGVASISQKNGKFAWFRANSLVLVKDKESGKTPNIFFDIETQTAKKFKGYLGVTNQIDFKIKDNGEVITPQIDKKNHIYYYVEPS